MIYAIVCGFPTPIKNIIERYAVYCESCEEKNVITWEQCTAEADVFCKHCGDRLSKYPDEVEFIEGVDSETAMITIDNRTFDIAYESFSLCDDAMDFPRSEIYIGWVIYNYTDGNESNKVKIEVNNEDDLKKHLKKLPFFKESDYGTWGIVEE